MNLIIPMSNRSLLSKSKIFTFYFYLAPLILVSCVSDHTTDIQKVSVAKIAGHKILISAPSGYCVIQEEKASSRHLLQFTLVDCIDTGSKNSFQKRPPSSIISANIFFEPELRTFNSIVDFLDEAAGKRNLGEFFGNNSENLKRSFIKDGVLFLSFESNSNSQPSFFGNRYWKALTLYDELLIVLTSKGFSKKDSNIEANRNLQRSILEAIRSIKIVNIEGS